MKSLLDRTRPLQIAFLAILLFSAAQVVWWMYDQALLVRRETERLQVLHDADRAAAGRLLAEGVAREEVAVLFPSLIVQEHGVRVNPAALETVEAEHHRRLRQYAFEGGFFLVVLAACMAVIGRTLREETLLRRRQENFIAAVTHEIKSPIASLQLSAETIALRHPDPLQLERLVDRMRSDIRRLEGMVGKILDTASLEAGRLQLRPERVPLDRLVADLAEEFGPRGEQQGVSLTRSIPEGLEIAADPAAARTVVRNLLENALRATAGAGGGSIAIRATAEGRHAELEVADTGVGFDPAEAERLFEKFYRPGDEMRRTSRGTGLGLYVVRRFVELEHGRVRASSEGPGKGARFVVSWPRPSEEDEE